MTLIARIFRVVIRAMHWLLAGLRWLAWQTYRQRSIGAAATPHLTRLLDLHAVTVAAHLTLVAALIVARPGPVARDWLLAAPAVLVLTGLGIWRSGRIALDALIIGQVAGLVVAALWTRDPIVLTLLAAVAVAQQATLVAAWLRHTGGVTGRSALGRATVAGLLLAVFTGGAGLVAGVFTPAVPLWIATSLLVVAAVLVWRTPRPPRPTLPRQSRAVPDGYAIYRPSSLDERS